MAACLTNIPQNVKIHNISRTCIRTISEPNFGYCIFLISINTGGDFLQLRDIQYVLKVSELGSFSRAAEELFVSQPALSQSVQKLENELGVKLFRRERNSVTLTYAGSIFVNEAQNIKETIDRIENKMSEAQDLKYGDLSIGVSPFYEKYYLSKILPEFHKKYPGIKLKITEGYTGELEELVMAKKIDLCIVSLPLNIASLYYEILFEENILLAVPPDHKLNSKLQKAARPGQYPTVDLSFFKNDDFIMYRPRRRLRSIGLDLCNEAKFVPNIIYETNNCETINALAAGGMGIGFIPMAAAYSCVSGQKAVYYSLAMPKAVRQFAVVYEKDIYHSSAIYEFIRIAHSLSDQITKLPTDQERLKDSAGTIIS
jgi:LysR family hydrogen peroxide-inducible transcriptional activator